MESEVQTESSPSPQASNDLTFFSVLDEATKEWLKSLDHIWQLCKYRMYYNHVKIITYFQKFHIPCIFAGKKCDVVTQMLIDYFNSAPNPYLSTLRILVNTSDFKHIKANSSLAFTGFSFLKLIM